MGQKEDVQVLLSFSHEVFWIAKGNSDFLGQPGGIRNLWHSFQNILLPSFTTAVHPFLLTCLCLRTNAERSDGPAPHLGQEALPAPGLLSPQTVMIRSQLACSGRKKYGTKNIAQNIPANELTLL